MAKSIVEVCRGDEFARLYFRERGISDVEWSSVNSLNGGRMEIKYRRKGEKATEDYISLICALDLISKYILENLK
jgi:hypothetical protein